MSDLEAGATENWEQMEATPTSNCISSDTRSVSYFQNLLKVVLAAEISAALIYLSSKMDLKMR